MSQDPPKRRAEDLPRSRSAILFGLLGGGIAWLAHLLLAYGIAEFGCRSELGAAVWMGVSVVAWMLLAVSGGTMMVSALAVLAAYRSWRRLILHSTSRDLTTGDAVVYTARMSMITSSLFALVILVESIPIFYYLHRC